MGNFDPVPYDPRAPRGGALYEPPSWFQSHIMAMLVAFATALTLFAIFAIHR